MPLFPYIFIFGSIFIFIFKLIRSHIISLNLESFISSVVRYLSIRNIDWRSDEIKRRTILASLLQGTYSLERKRQGKDTGAETPESWWIKFGFECIESLVDDNGSCYYGAIFKNKYFDAQRKCRPNPPKYIIAYRGSLLMSQTFNHDLSLDLNIVSQRLHKNPLVKKALATLLDVIELAGRRPEHVWMAGHSLGASISLAVGRELFLEHNVSIETFLFNPPIVSSPYELPRSLGLAIKTIVTPLIESLVHQSRTSQEGERFNKLSSWIPHLFVNEHDPICKGYISYFRHRNMKGAATAKEHVATQYSALSLIGEFCGRDWEPTHLIPSANLTITSTYDFKPFQFQAHRIGGWLKPDLEFSNEQYRFN